MNKQIDAMREFIFSVDMVEGVGDYLKNIGYEKRNGSCTYQHKCYWVVPLKKWYYPMDSKACVHVSIEEFQPAPIFRLSVETR